MKKSTHAQGECFGTCFRVIRRRHYTQKRERIHTTHLWLPGLNDGPLPIPG